MSDINRDEMTGKEFRMYCHSMKQSEAKYNAEQAKAGKGRIRKEYREDSRDYDSYPSNINNRSSHDESRS